MAQFEPEGAVGEHVTMNAFGGNFGRDEGAAWRPFLEVEEVGPQDGSPQRALEGPAGLVRRLVGELPAVNSDGEIVLADLELTADLIENMLAGEVHQLFLKQFRDAEDGTRAAYQSVVEAPCKILSVSNKLVGRDADVTIHQLDSHPIAQEMGVTSQRAQIVFDAELDMIVEHGVEVARPASALPSSGPAAAVAGDGYTSYVEVVARRAWRELTGLERAVLGRFRRR
jgi:hypothetical protein